MLRVLNIKIHIRIHMHTCTYVRPVEIPSARQNKNTHMQRLLLPAGNYAVSGSIEGCEAVERLGKSFKARMTVRGRSSSRATGPQACDDHRA